MMHRLASPWSNAESFVVEKLASPLNRSPFGVCENGLLIRYYQIFGLVNISQYYKYNPIHKTIIKCNKVRKYKRHLIFTWKPSTGKNHGLVSAPHSNLESTNCDSVYNLIPV
jgi:hypothetical protein